MVLGIVKRMSASNLFRLISHSSGKGISSKGPPVRREKALNWLKIVLPSKIWRVNIEQLCRGLSLFMGSFFMVVFFLSIQKNDYSEIGYFAFGIPFLSLMWLWKGRKFILFIEAMNNRWFLVLSIVIFAVLRILWLVSLRTLPHVDFATFDYIAVLLSKYRPIQEDLSMYFLLPAWGYPFFLGIWYSLVGHTLVAGKLFNLLLGIASVPLIYKVSKQIAGTLTARMTTILFVLWPTQMMMSTVLASEHLAIFLIMIAFSFLVKETEKHQMRNVVFSAIFLALAYIVRHASVAVLPAAILLFLISGDSSKILRLKTVSVLTIGFVAVYAFYLAGMTLVYHVTPLSQGLFNLLVGTNVASKGHWNMEDQEKYFSYPTFAEANDYAKKEILRRVTSNPGEIVKLMGYKSILTWWNGTYGFYWSTLKVADDPLTSEIISNKLLFEGIAHYFHLLILLFCTVGYLSLFSDIDILKYSPILLVLFFGTGFHMILETQYRYNYVMIPFLLIIAAKGICSIYIPAPPRSVQIPPIPGE